ncbi:MAG TPA: squalene/phytoene synthase family protein [Planctomycetota bacterium]|nr:squalene/phytoene synthase family protein [Planctomycetota bacterium]
MATIGSLRLLKDLFSNRAEPDLLALSRIRESDAFLWAILPHAARTFAKSIHLLPRPLRKPCAVAYLYARMLDTYEDHVRDPAAREHALAAFADRIGSLSAGCSLPVPSLKEAHDADPRDQVHRLLLERCALVDQEFAVLPPTARGLIRELIEAMALGMQTASRWFASQGGALLTAEQLDLYCRAVLGEPAVFMVRLLAWLRRGDAHIDESLRQTCLQSGVMIQLANVTRDIEKDLARGVAYHPDLASDLARDATSEPTDSSRTERIRRVRAALTRRALALSPHLQDLLLHLAPSGWRRERSSLVLLFLHTDRHFLKMAHRCGIETWGPVKSPLRLLMESVPTTLSYERAERILSRTVALHRRTLKGSHG